MCGTGLEITQVHSDVKIMPFDCMSLGFALSLRVETELGIGNFFITSNTSCNVQSNMSVRLSNQTCLFGFEGTDLSECCFFKFGCVKEKTWNLLYKMSGDKVSR